MGFNGPVKFTVADMAKEWQLQESLFDKGFQEGGESASAGFAKVIEGDAARLERDLKDAAPWRQRGAALWVASEKLVGSVFFGLCDWVGKSSNEFSKGPVAVAWKAAEIAIVGIGDSLIHVLDESFDIGRGKLEGQSEFRATYTGASLMGETLLLGLSTMGLAEGAGKIGGTFRGMPQRVGFAQAPALNMAIAVDSLSAGVADMGAMMMSEGPSTRSGPVLTLVKSPKEPPPQEPSPPPPDPLIFLQKVDLMRVIQRKFDLSKARTQLLNLQIQGTAWKVIEYADRIEVQPIDGSVAPEIYEIKPGQNGLVTLSKRAVPDETLALKSSGRYLPDVELLPFIMDMLHEFKVLVDARQILTMLRERIKGRDVWVDFADIDVDTRTIVLTTTSLHRITITVFQDASGALAFRMGPAESIRPLAPRKMPVGPPPVIEDAGLWTPFSRGRLLGQDDAFAQTMESPDWFRLGREQRRARTAPRGGIQRTINLDGKPLRPASVNEPHQVRSPKDRAQVDVYGHPIPRARAMPGTSSPEPTMTPATPPGDD